MRRSRKQEIIDFLSFHPNGVTWADLVFHFPRKTIDRHLKALVEEGQVERVLEARKKGQKGRQSTRYKPVGMLVMKFVGKWRGRPPTYLGRDKKRYGTKIVSLFSKEKKKADEDEAYLDHMKRRDRLRKNHPQGFEKLLKLEHEKRGRATDRELLEIEQSADSAEESVFSKGENGGEAS